MRLSSCCSFRDWFFFRQNRYLFWGWAFVFGLNLYLIASWWCWWYGGGLGMRALIEFSIFLALPIAFLLEASLRIMQPLYLVFLYLGCWVYQTYQYQFNTSILPADNVDKAFFRQVFMKTDKRFEWSFFFRDNPLPKGRMTHRETRYYHPETKSWDTLTRSNQFDFENDPKKDFDINCGFLTDKTRHDKIAVVVSGEAWISKESANPGFFVMFTRNGKEVGRKQFFVGGRIRDLYKPTPFKVSVNPWLYTDDLEAVFVVFNRGQRPMAFRRIKVSYLNFSGN